MEKLAVFDFDGTCISGNSPYILTWYLHYKGRMTPKTAAQLISWGIAYKLHLPQNESWVRGLVFRAFKGETREFVDEFLREFCREEVLPLMRPKAIECMEDCHARGLTVVMVSATFEPILLEAGKVLPYDYQMSTRMQVTEDNRYTNLVEGLPCEGAEKVRALKSFADAQFGQGNWDVVESYGDHHSDIPIISLAKHGFAVTPDKTLKRCAKREGWTILDW